MFRLGLVACGFFAVVGFFWAVYDPIAARWDVSNFAGSGPGEHPAERLILSRGRAALESLRTGLDDSRPEVRLRCAGLLAVALELSGEGEESGDRKGAVAILVRELSNAETDSPTAQLCERLLVRYWSVKGSPDGLKAADLVTAVYPDSSKTSPSPYERRLQGLLAANRNWVGGYAALAQMYYDRQQYEQAEQQAFNAWQLDYDEFEALALLGLCRMRQSDYASAITYFELALERNPRLKARLHDELERARKAENDERERRLKEKRLERPLT